IVTIMLIPQSLAYAMLAGLPPQVGLYASILPLVAYGIFGSSRTLAVGPVAVVSLMTAAATAGLVQRGVTDAWTASIALAALSGVMLTLMGVLRLGFLASFLSHPVISGFISASGIIIATSQVGGILGIPSSGQALPEILRSLWEGIGKANLPTAIIGIGVAAFLFWSRKWLKPLLLTAGASPAIAGLAGKVAPVFSVAVTIALTWWLGLEAQGVKSVGAIPAGLPPLTMPALDLVLIRELAAPALLISIVGFVESVSVAQTLAAKRRQRISPDQELIGLGASNIASGISGGYPVTGGFARSVVNFDAGAETPAAGMFTAIGIAIATLLLTPVLYHLPKATLAATIIVAVLSLVDFGALRRTWAYSRLDGAAMATTILLTLAEGVETGIVAGVVFSILAFLYLSSRPHYAIVGQVPGTEHFRNVKRHKVVTAPNVLTLRVDESLYFANARYLEDIVLEKVAADPRIRHLVLMFPSVSHVDTSALESLEALNFRLKDAGVSLHLSEVKGPVMDRLRRSDFLDHLTGKVFLTQYDAMRQLAPATAASARAGDAGTGTGGLP
nr:sulfate permease [Nitratireductor sp.]